MGKQKSVFAALRQLTAILGLAIKSMCVLYWYARKADASRTRIVYARQQARRLLRLMGIRVTWHGSSLVRYGCLNVANHVSWLDVLVILSGVSCRFIAKAEVQKYPVIGRIASSAGTLFLNRTSIKDAVAVSKVVSQALEEGDNVTFFPEGTTSEGTGLLPLHASLFDAAVSAKAEVQPIVLRFHRKGTLKPDLTAAYIDKKTLFSILWDVLHCTDLEVFAVVLDPIQPLSQDTRRSLCQRVEQMMEDELDRLNSMQNPYEALSEEALRSLFFQDTDNMAMYGLQACKQLLTYPGKRDALLKLRQSFYISNSSASRAGYVLFADAAYACQLCIDSWLRAKLPVSSTLISFCVDALEQMQSWAIMIKEGEIPLMDFKKIDRTAKRLTYKGLDVTNT